MSGKGGVVIGAGVFMVAAAGFVFSHFGNGVGLGFGGNGEGDESSGNVASVSVMSDEVDEETETEVEEKMEILIKVDEDKIFYDDVECKDVEELKDLICKDAGDGLNFKYENKYAIKSVDDDVKQLLEDLKGSIGITVID